ncbi:hypothetical protein ABTN28_19275, partial [Acinetobacter baumannii]
MCFSAQVEAAYRRYTREFGAIISIVEFARLYGHRLEDPKIRIPKAMDAGFAHPQNEAERQIKAA